jgi:hypothetical protein
MTHSNGRKWWRRLFTAPSGQTGRSGPIVGGDPTRRLFDGWLAKLIRLRDQTCRDPYCEAAIRHIDHITRHADGGITIYTNGRGRLRTRQLHSRNARMAHQPHRHRPSRHTAHHPDHHTHRPSLPQPRPRPAMKEMPGIRATSDWIVRKRDSSTSTPACRKTSTAAPTKPSDTGIT